MPWLAVRDRTTGRCRGKSQSADFLVSVLRILRREYIRWVSPPKTARKNRSSSSSNSTTPCTSRSLERLLRKRRRLQLNRRKKPELISTGRTLRLDVRRWAFDVRPSYGRDVSRSHREREQSFRQVRHSGRSRR